MNGTMKTTMKSTLKRPKQEVSKYKSPKLKRKEQDIIETLTSTVDKKNEGIVLPDDHVVS
jgi:Tfp pilus assembly protein PilN